MHAMVTRNQNPFGTSACFQMTFNSSRVIGSRLRHERVLLLTGRVTVR